MMCYNTLTKVNFQVVRRSLFVVICLGVMTVTSAQAVTLQKVRFAYEPDKIRAVFDFDEPFTYNADEDKQQITIYLKNVEGGSDLKNFVELNDGVVRYFEIERQGPDLKIFIPLLEPIDYYLFSLNDPPRLIIDFDRKYTSITSGGLIADGVELLKIHKGTEDGPVFANALKIDLTKAEVAPVLARKQKASFWESFIDLILPWQINSGPNSHFYLDKVGNMVNDNDAIAGINGTYFASTGSPLGALVIDRELVSFPIYDRTAFFIDENNQPYVDNMYVNSSLTLGNGTKFDIAGINRRRSADDIVLYSPAWGNETKTNEQGLELVVIDSMIKEINLADSKIPDSGYVISVSGKAVGQLTNNIRVGDTITTNINLVPYETSPNKIINLVSGGPRLIKKGMVYVSKYEENFQRDIARGRAARTAIGITKDNQLLLLTVDGLQSSRSSRKEMSNESIGITLEDLSTMLLSLGAVEAMNLDGGSSTTMVVGGRTINQPTVGYQRQVSNALIVRSKI